MDELLQQGLLKYRQASQIAWEQMVLFWPRLINYNPFELFLILNLTVLSVFIIVSLISKISISAAYRRIMKGIFSLGPIKGKVQAQIDKAKKQILAMYPDSLLPHLDKVPYKTPTTVINEVGEKQSLKGKLSGSRYAFKNHSEFVMNLAKLFSYSNPLHYDIHPLLKQMQNEAIDMAADMVGLKDENGASCGTLNSGGTESINMAIYAYREYMIKNRGVKCPNLVICTTGHAAAIKACKYMDIEIRLVPCDTRNYSMDIGKMKRQIDQNTICVYASYPNYPYGTHDDLKTIGAYCAARKVPVHADMCLGGYIVPWIQEGWKVPKGVTSISLDPHKYGLSAKGAGILLYSSQKYRQCQYFVTLHWPGGLYATPGIAGSRTGVYIVSAWVSMMKLGAKGLRENARILKKTVTECSSQLKELGFEIFGKPEVCVLAFKHPRYSVNCIYAFMQKRGWGLALVQRPLAIHFSFTPLNCPNKDKMMSDMKECLAYLAKNPEECKEASEIQLYGACATIPDDDTKHELLSNILDTFIDLE